MIFTRKSPKTTKVEFEELSNRVIGCATEVHGALGPGLLESAYEQCLAHELRLQGIDYHLQWPVPVHYKDMRIDCGYRVSLLVQSSLIVEVKSVEQILSIHEAQILTYLKLSGLHTGLLINFNVSLLKDGIRRFAL